MDLILYIENQERLNKLIPGILEYGGKNREVLYSAPKDQQILDIVSENDRFGDQNGNLHLQLTDYQGRPVTLYNPRYNSKLSKSIERYDDVGNIVRAERLIGGYSQPNKLNPSIKDVFPGWNQTQWILDKNSNLLMNSNPKRLYVRGIGPNGVKEEVGMVTLQAPNGGVPSFKFGKKLIRFVNKK